MERRKEGDAQAAIGKCVQNAMGCSCNKEAEENSKIAAQNLISQEERDGCGHQAGEQKGMCNSTMAKQGVIGDSEIKSEHIHIRQHGAARGEQTDFSPARARGQRLRDGYAGHCVRQNGWHLRRAANYFAGSDAVCGFGGSGRIAVPSNMYTNSFGGIAVGLFWGPALPITVPIPPISATYCWPSN